MSFGYVLAAIFLFSFSFDTMTVGFFIISLYYIFIEPAFVFLLSAGAAPIDFYFLYSLVYWVTGGGYSFCLLSLD
jgi:hypothetical protein